MTILLAAFAVVGVGILIRSFAATPTGQPAGFVVATMGTPGWTCHVESPSPNANACVSKSEKEGTYFPIGGYEIDTVVAEGGSQWDPEDYRDPSYYETRKLFKYESGQTYQICLKVKGSGGITVYGPTASEDQIGTAGAGTTINFDHASYKLVCSNKFIPPAKDSDDVFAFKVGTDRNTTGFDEAFRLQSLILIRNPGWIEGRVYGTGMGVSTKPYINATDANDKSKCTATPTDEYYQTHFNKAKGVLFECPNRVEGALRVGRDTPLTSGKTYKVCGKLHSIKRGFTTLEANYWGTDPSYKKGDKVLANVAPVAGTSDHFGCTEEIVAGSGKGYSVGILSSKANEYFAGDVFYISLMEKVQ